MLIFFSSRWLLPDFPLATNFYPTAFVLDGHCHELGSPYGNQRALPLIFPFPSFIFPFTSYFLLQQRSIFPFARVDPWGSLFVLLQRRLPPPPPSPIASAAVISSLSSFPFFFRLSQVFIGGYSLEWVLLSRAPPLRFVPTTTSRGAL